jgi:hypothetical protein
MDLVEECLRARLHLALASVLVLEQELEQELALVLEQGSVLVLEQV